MQVRYRPVGVWRWRGRFADVSVRRCKCIKAREKICRKKEGQDRCQGATVWMYRCDIDVQMCGCGEVER